MTWIQTVRPDAADGLVKRGYDASDLQFGFIPNIRRALSLNPIPS